MFGMLWWITKMTLRLLTPKLHAWVVERLRGELCNLVPLVCRKLFKLKAVFSSFIQMDTNLRTKCEETLGSSGGGICHSNWGGQLNRYSMFFSQHEPPNGWVSGYKWNDGPPAPSGACHLRTCSPSKGRRLWDLTAKHHGFCQGKRGGFIWGWVDIN